MRACRGAFEGITARLAGLRSPGMLALVLLAAVALPPPAGAADFNVGFIGGLSGAQANRAQDQLDGFQLGIKHLGGRLGSMEFGFSVIDDRRQPALAKQAAEHLLQSDRVQVLLLSSDAASAPAVLPVAVASKTFVISLDAPAPELAGKACSPYFFSLSGLTDTMHELAGQYLQAQGYHRLVIADMDIAADKDAVTAFRRGFKGDVVEVTGRRGDMNFQTELRRIRAASPDAVYLLHTGGMAVNFILQFAASGLKGDFPLFGPPTTLDQTVLDAAGPAALDAFSVAPWSDDLDTPANHRMMTDFETDYGRPASLFAAEGYDAAMLLDAALKVVGKKFNDEDALRKALRASDFLSTRGAFRFDTNHFPIQSYVVRQAVLDARERMSSEQRGMLVHDARDGHASECSMRWVAEPPPKG